MPIYKRCSRCGKRMPAGRRCTCVTQRHKEYDKHSRDRKAKQYYNSAEWERSRAAVLELDEGLDVYQYVEHGRVVAADTVHHIVPLRDDWDKRNKLDNLMSLHHDTHSAIEQLYKQNKSETIKRLQSMVKVFRSELRNSDGRGG